MSTKYSMVVSEGKISIISSENDGRTWSPVCLCDDMTIARVIVDALNGDAGNLHAECHYELFAVKQDLSVITEIAIEASLILKPYMSLSAPIDRSRVGMFLNRLEGFLQQPTRI